jgi:L-iditol 2-dehydrogenase
MVLGHEVAGEVVEVGSSVTSVKVGDRVTVEPLKACGTCAYCLENNYHLCSSRVGAGTQGWLGSIAEYFAAPEDKVFVLPKSMDFDTGLLVEPLAVAAHAVKLSRLQANENTIIIGTGPIGLLTAAASQARVSRMLFVPTSMIFGSRLPEILGLRPLMYRKNLSWKRQKNLHLMDLTLFS